MTYPLRQTIAPNVNTNLNDVFGVKLALNALGDLEIRDDDDLHEYPNDELFTSIRKFQARKGLEADGVIKRTDPQPLRWLPNSLEPPLPSENRSASKRARPTLTNAIAGTKKSTFRRAVHSPADAELERRRSAMLLRLRDWLPALLARR